MARRPREYLDELDKKILNMLQKDGRLSFTDIAKKLKIPQSTARFKVLNLISRGYIKKFVAIPDYEKIGYPYALVMLLDVDLNKISDIMSELENMEEIHHVLQTTGRHDLVAIFMAASLQHINEIVKKVKTMPGIKGAEVLVVTGRLIISPGVPVK